MSSDDLTPDYHKPVTHADLAAVATEQQRLWAEIQRLREEVVTLCAAIRGAGFEPVMAQNADGSSATKLIPIGTPSVAE